MAAVTEEVILNLLKSNYNHLKNFAELMNAEVTEDEQDYESREKYKDDISRILEGFGQSEANFSRIAECLKLTKNEIFRNSEDVNEEECDRDQLMKDVDTIINIIEGKTRSTEEEPVYDMQVSEDRIVQLLEKVEDILIEYNPLKFHDEDDDENNENNSNEIEEQRICQILEKFQQKSIKKMETNMTAQDDDENAMEIESEPSEDDEDSSESAGPSGINNRSNIEEKRQVDLKLKEMWNNYTQKISNISEQNIDQVLENKIQNTKDFNLDELKHFPNFNKSILDLFSREAIVVLREKKNYVDPISKMEIRNPLRNKICTHIYEKETILSLFRTKKEIPCPCLGCSCRSFTAADLEEDEELTEQITQCLSRNAAASTSYADFNATAEYLDSDNDESINE